MCIRDSSQIDRVPADLDLFAPPLTHEEADHDVLVQQFLRLVRLELSVGEIDDRVGRNVDHARFRPIEEEIEPVGCLLYTSDAADDLLRVDLGGRRLIKK